MVSWEKDLKMRKPEALAEARSTYAKDIRFYQMLQYLFFKQWWELKAYVNEKGIEIIGDVPIYVAGDSADVWANPKEFYLDEDLNPIDVAGCPPDAFSEDGQLWGNPLFRWDVMKKNGYTWWTKRIAAMSKLYDIVGLTISADLIPTMRFRQRIRRQRMVSGARDRAWICFIRWSRSLAD